MPNRAAASTFSTRSSTKGASVACRPRRAMQPPSYDAHREETFALIHPAAPHYNTLLRIDPLDPAGPRVVGALATSWAISPDRRTYVLRLRHGVKFHDGSELTSRDVRATYEKIINPPPGITSGGRRHRSSTRWRRRGTGFTRRTSSNAISVGTRRTLWGRAPSCSSNMSRARDGSVDATRSTGTAESHTSTGIKRSSSATTPIRYLPSARGAPTSSSEAFLQRSETKLSVRSV